MSAQDEDTEKSHDATPRKLEDARKRGEVPRSTDLSVAASYGGLVLAAIVFGSGSVIALGNGLVVLIDQSPAISELIFKGPAKATLGGIIVTTGTAIAPWFLLPSLLVLLSIFSQRAFVVTPDKVQFKLKRISLISNAKNKFGRNGLFEFAKSFTKLAIYSVCLALFLKVKLPDMLVSVQTNSSTVVLVLAQLGVEFLFLAFLIAISIGAIDLLWQRSEHLRKNRMSRKELTDEAKESEGDPHLKQERRQRAIQVASSRMLQDVKIADVVIVNPTHFAVALKWSRKPGEAPVCVAKGADEVAFRIREVAHEALVPVHSDPATARALFVSIEVGQEISTVHYQAVAASIRFAEAMRKRVWRAC